MNLPELIQMAIELEFQRMIEELRLIITTLQCQNNQRFRFGKKYKQFNRQIVIQNQLLNTRITQILTDLIRKLTELI